MPEDDTGDALAATGDDGERAPGADTDAVQADDVDDAQAEGSEDIEGDLPPLDAFSGGEPAVDAFNRVDGEAAVDEEGHFGEEEGSAGDGEGSSAIDEASSQSGEGSGDEDASPESDGAPPGEKAPVESGLPGAADHGGGTGDPASPGADDTSPTGGDVHPDRGALPVDGEAEEPSDLQQRHGPGHSQPDAVDSAPADRVDMFFQQGSQTIRQLNPHSSYANCPSTAAAVDHFLRTGQVIPAESAGPGEKFAYDERFKPVTDVHALLVQPGMFVVLRGTSGEVVRGNLSEHYFVVVNRAGTLWALDAYSHETAEFDSYLSGNRFQSLDYYPGPFSVRRVPAGP